MGKFYKEKLAILLDKNTEALADEKLMITQER